MEQDLRLFGECKLLRCGASTALLLPLAGFPPLGPNELLWLWLLFLFLFLLFLFLSLFCFLLCLIRNLCKLLRVVCRGINIHIYIYTQITVYVYTCSRNIY